MKHITLFTIVVALLLTPMQTHALGADSCRQKVNTEIAKEQRLYRSYLFGKKKAEDASIGAVRYDTDGWAWIKDAEDKWINSEPDNQSLEWSDSTMDDQYEHSRILPLTGIFETRRVTTSELIPYVLQSMRAMECRLKTLCEVARYSEVHDGDDPVDIEAIHIIGCVKFTEMETWPQCHFGKPEQGIPDQADSRSYCDEIADQLMRREIELLKLTVEYDAGFRSLLQFAGNFDTFLREMRWPLTGTLRQAVQLLGNLERIPCFISSCDSAPTQIE